MKKVNFIFGVHNHQPVGNFGMVFEELYQKSYEPFLTILHKHPRVKCVFHVTGPLLEWIEANRPEYFKRLKEMTDRGQVELFTGAMYEPILAVLPDRDKVGQIRTQTAYLKDKFKAAAEGMWLAERVWEPHLTKSLAEAGVKYIVTDDAHLKAVGLKEEQTFGHYLMEEQGETVSVFPISEKMRYLVPFQAVDAAIDYLRSVEGRSGETAFELDLLEHPSMFAQSGLLTLDRQKILRDAVERLTPNQRIVIELAYYEGLSQTEMAERLKQPLGTVKTWVRTALKMLRQELGEAVA